MPGIGATAGKNHAPRAVRDLAPEFAVDIVAHTAKEQARGHQRGHQVRDVEKRAVAGARKVPESAKNAEQAAVKGHAPVPDAQNLHRIGYVDGQVVEQHIAQAAAQNDADHDAGQQVVHIGSAPAGIGTGCAPAPQPPAQAEAREIHEAVPAQLKVAETEGNGVDMRQGH